MPGIDEQPAVERRRPTEAAVTGRKSAAGKTARLAAPDLDRVRGGAADARVEAREKLPARDPGLGRSSGFQYNSDTEAT